MRSEPYKTAHPGGEFGGNGLLRGMETVDMILVCILAMYAWTLYKRGLHGKR